MSVKMTKVMTNQLAEKASWLEQSLAGTCNFEDLDVLVYKVMITYHFLYNECLNTTRKLLQLLRLCHYAVESELQVNLKMTTR